MEGDLGRLARRCLQVRLSSQEQPCHVRGAVWLSKDGPQVSDSLGASAYRIEITMELERASSVWRASGEAIYLRGAELASMRVARRSALEEAVQNACLEIVKDFEF